ncbi:hypothetical protein BC829DRAFT_389642 [Chytridium lagenaria]|nr:hypothetical protein BC829DRAFT_389642 [Chytridium lagenaria]
MPTEKISRKTSLSEPRNNKKLAPSQGHQLSESRNEKKPRRKQSARGEPDYMSKSHAISFEESKDNVSSVIYAQDYIREIKKPEESAAYNSNVKTAKLGSCVSLAANAKGNGVLESEKHGSHVAFKNSFSPIFKIPKGKKPNNLTDIVNSILHGQKYSK